MREASRYLTWLTAGIMLVAWVLNVDQMESLAFQRERDYRNISGLVVMGLVLFQWGLTLGRTVFQRSGSQWSGWVDWHLRSALVLPFAMLAHSIAYGWGLLILLPPFAAGCSPFRFHAQRRGCLAQKPEIPHRIFCPDFGFDGGPCGHRSHF